jgi:hypothetical protein
MRRQAVRAVTAALVALVCALATAAAATAATSGPERFDGLIVAVPGSAGERTVLQSVIVVRGVFSGVGRIVEVPNLPGDPDNVARDDLVFADGTIHLVSTTLDFQFRLDPRSCVFRAVVTQTAVAAGGTGRFAAASGSFTGGVTARGIAARNPDGSCSQEQTVLVDLDTLSGTGTLSF